MLGLVGKPTSAFFSVQNNLLKLHFRGGQFAPEWGGQFAPEKVVSLLRNRVVNFTGFSNNAMN